MKKITNKEYHTLTEYRKAETHGKLLTLDGIRFICESYGNDPEKIGRHFLLIVASNSQSTSTDR